MDGDDPMAMMNALFGQMLGGMIGAAGFGGQDPRMCAEGGWRGHPAGPLFRAAESGDASAIEVLLQQDHYKALVDELDGDGGGALHVLGLNGHKVAEDEAAEIVETFKTAGADLDLRAGGMLSAETALHAAACYGHWTVIKALLEAGATADTSDDMGRTPLNRAEKASGKPGVGAKEAEKSLELLREAVERERNASSNYVEAKVRRAEELMQQGDGHYEDGDWELAANSYNKSISCHDLGYQAHAKHADAALEDAIDRMINDRSGYRNQLKMAWMEGSKALEMCPDNGTEKLWVQLARAFLGYRELPRAKKVCADAAEHFPQCKRLAEIWSVLDHVGVPDTVVDHESEEFKAIVERLYEDRWIGEIACHYCGLSCMDDPRPEQCPFCGCPDKDIEEEEDEMIVFLTVGNTALGEDDDSDGVDDDVLFDDDDDDDDDADAAVDQTHPSNAATGFSFEPPTDASEAQSPSTPSTFSFGSPAAGSSTFVFGSPEAKEESK